MKRSDVNLVDCGSCPYLANRWWHSAAMHVEEIAPEELEPFFDQGYQRFGQSLYVPSCRGCTECVPIRLDVLRYRPSRTQRQVWKRNQDVEVRIGPPHYTKEAYDLYLQFMLRRFPNSQPPNENYFQFLLECHYGFSAMFTYWLEGRMAGFGVLDPTPRSAYSYMFAWHFDFPDRRLGAFSLLKEVEFCRQTGREHLYLGLFVRDCPSMNYKANFKPYELRNSEGAWIEYC